MIRRPPRTTRTDPSFPTRRSSDLPGVTIFASTGTAYLAVNRGNKIDAVGTPTQPIIFTGRGNVVGSATDNTSQLWGGIILLGRAPVTDCIAPGAAEGTVEIGRASCRERVCQYV